MVHVRFLVAQEGAGVAALGGLHVVVQVAIAQVAEVDQAYTGNLACQQCVGVFAERRDARDRHRDVVLDVQPFLGLRQRNAFADVPQAVRLRQALGHHRVLHAVVLEGSFQQCLKARTRVRLGFAVGVFQQHAVGHVLSLHERYAQLRHVLGHQRQGEAPHHLEPRQPRAQVLVRQAQQAYGSLHGRHGRPGSEAGSGLWKELERGGGNDAQRALTANEQVAQVVAGVVLAQPLETMPHLALGRHYLQPQAQLACVAIAHDLRTARVGAQVAADGAAALGRQAEGEQQARLGCGRLHVLQNAAGLHGQRQVVLVDGSYGVQARQAQHHLGAAGVGCGADRQAGVAALRHD